MCRQSLGRHTVPSFYLALPFSPSRSLLRPPQPEQTDEEKQTGATPVRPRSRPGVSMECAEHLARLPAIQRHPMPRHSVRHAVPVHDADGREPCPIELPEYGHPIELELIFDHRFIPSDPALFDSRIPVKFRSFRREKPLRERFARSLSELDREPRAQHRHDAIRGRSDGLKHGHVNFLRWRPRDRGLTSRRRSTGWLSGPPERGGGAAPAAAEEPICAANWRGRRP